MSCPRRLKLVNVNSLGMFPEGLRYITTLQEMPLVGLTSSLEERIKVIDGREGEDFYKVCHIPSIDFVKNVALHADPCNTAMELSLLTDDESWNLLCRKAFPRSKMGSQCSSEEFVKLGKEMVKKCGGLPLAIVALGCLLATKQSLAQWEMVHKNIHGHLNELPHQDRQYGVVNRILVSSYNALPYPLKPCFLYLSHYPEDWEIPKKQLICLWIAEGFIPKTEEFLMEDLGEKFLLQH
ncbi:hypothetical protein Gotur_020139 [Gossypium turneri]